MTKTEALNSAVFGASGVRLNDDQCEQVFRDFRLAGFAIVPIEPTQKMIEAARKEDTNGTHITYATSYEHWDAMIAAYEKEMGDG